MSEAREWLDRLTETIEREEDYLARLYLQRYSHNGIDINFSFDTGGNGLVHFTYGYQMPLLAILIGGPFHNQYRFASSPTLIIQKNKVRYRYRLRNSQYGKVYVYSKLSDQEATELIDSWNRGHIWSLHHDG